MPDKCRTTARFFPHFQLVQLINMEYYVKTLRFFLCAVCGSVFLHLNLYVFSCDSIRICVDWKPAQSSALYVVLYKCLTYNRFAILYFIRCRFFLLRFPYSNWNEYPPYFLSVWYHHNISVLYQYIQVEEIFCYPLMSIDSLMLFTNKLGW